MKEITPFIFTSSLVIELVVQLVFSTLRLASARLTCRRRIIETFVR
jgi:hypothetical protein